MPRVSAELEARVSETSQVRATVRTLDGHIKTATRHINSLSLSLAMMKEDPPVSPKVCQELVDLLYDLNSVCFTANLEAEGCYRLALKAVKDALDQSQRKAEETETQPELDPLWVQEGSQG